MTPPADGQGVAEELIVVLLERQQGWVSWLRNPVGCECPDPPIGRGAGWTTAVKVAAGVLQAVNDPRLR